MSHHAQQAAIAVLSSIGGIAMLGMAISAMSEGARSGWLGACSIVALVCGGLLYLLGVH
ncbi:hypothetical protein ACWX0K_10850 [Nitrobacteraceae bacterium UC4446_H13]